MAAPRIEPLEGPFEPAVAEAFKRFLPPGMEPLKLFRTQAHNPRVLQRMFAANLLDAGSVSVRVRELVILRTCARCGSEYEWGVHVALFAKAAGLGEGEVKATLERVLAKLDLVSSEMALFKAVDELHETSTLSDGVWSELARYYTAAQILEVIALVGNYHAVSFVTNAVRVEGEGFAPGFGVQ